MVVLLSEEDFCHENIPADVVALGVVVVDVSPANRLGVAEAGTVVLVPKPNRVGAELVVVVDKMEPVPNDKDG